jgi:hypothetical protein
MKKHIYSVLIYLLLASYCLAGGATAPPPAGLKGDGARGIIVEGGGDFSGPVVIGQTSPTTIDDNGVETPAIIVGEPISSVEESANWVIHDATQTIIGQIQFVCTDITDGSQDCAWKFFSMQAGVLTLQLTVPTP